MMKKLILPALICFFFQLHPAISKGDQQEFEKGILPFFTALQNKNWDGFIRYFPEKDQHNFIAILTNLNPIAQNITSKDQLYAAYKPVMFDKSLQAKFIPDIKYYLIEGDLAYVESDNDVIIPEGNGKPYYHKLVNIVFVFKKIDGQWYFIFDYNRILKDLT